MKPNTIKGSKGFFKLIPIETMSREELEDAIVELGEAYTELLNRSNNIL